MNSSNTPSQKHIFHPPGWWSWVYGLGAVLTLVGFGVLAWQAWLARGSPAFGGWLAGTVVLAFLAPGLAFGWWWTRRTRYTLTADTLHLQAPGAQVVVPLESIVWAGLEAHYDQPLPPPPRGWPGLLVGLVALPQGPTVAFYGLTRARRVVLEDDQGRVFVLTPGHVVGFLAVLRAYLETEAPVAAPDPGAGARAASIQGETLPSATGQEAAPALPVSPNAEAAAEDLVPGGEREASSVPIPRLGWAVMGLAWVVSLALVAWAQPRLLAWPPGLRYALYAHLVTLGAETGGGHALLAWGRRGYAYALWAAGLLAAVGLGWALWAYGE